MKPNNTNEGEIKVQDAFSIMTISHNTLWRVKISAFFLWQATDYKPINILKYYSPFITGLSFWKKYVSQTLICVYHTDKTVATDTPILKDKGPKNLNPLLNPTSRIVFMSCIHKSNSCAKIRSYVKIYLSVIVLYWVRLHTCDKGHFKCICFKINKKI